MNSAKLTKFFPFLGFYKDPKTLITDLTAGTTVGLVLVPQAMAYAALAGMPPQTGLYAACFACMVGAAFGQCAVVNTGPVAMTSLLSFAALGALADIGTEQYWALAAILAILVGVIRIVIGLIKGTFLVTLISQSVLLGFTSAAGITIASTQVPKFFALEKLHENPVYNVFLMILKIDDAHFPSLMMGLGTLIVMILFKKFLPKWPGLLIALVGATLISHSVNFQSLGGQIVGELPAGLPEFSLPTEGWDLTLELLPSALLVAIIGLLEVMTVTSAAERLTKRSTDLNAELVGQGLASICAGVTSGFPVSGSLSRSSLNMLAGAVTGLSSVFSGLIVLLALLWFTPLLQPMPYPALAAAIVMAVSALIKFKPLFQAWKIKRSDVVFGLATFIITLAGAPSMTLGMCCGIGLSVGWFVFKVMTPRCMLMQKGEDGRWAKAPNQNETSNEKEFGAVVLRMDARFVFLNSNRVLNRAKTLISSRDFSTRCVFCFASINDIDATGCAALVELKSFMESRGSELILADVKAPIRKILSHHEVLKDLMIRPTLDDALVDLKE